MGQPTIQQRVLVVDESPDIREAFSLVLGEAGYSVVSTASIEDAFDEIERERPDVVVTDVVFTEPLGLELLSRIRTELMPPPPKIVVCTGFKHFEKEAIALGADAFLLKPIEAEELVAAVDAVLRPDTGPGESERIASELEQRSIELRRASARAAVAALDSLGPQKEDLIARANQGARWVASYLGFSRADLLLLEDNQLRVTASSATQSEALVESCSNGLSLARDVVETQSTILLPDANRYLEGCAGGPHLGLFVGVPVFGPGKIAIGALCLSEPRRRRVDPEDLSLLEHLGRRVSARLKAESDSEAPFFTPSGLLTREALQFLLRIESERARRLRAVLEIAVLRFPAGVDLNLAANELASASDAPRRSIAALDEHTLGVLFVRRAPHAALSELERTVAGARKRGLLGAGLATVENVSLPLPGIAQLLNTCEVIAARGRVERLSVRGESWPSAEHA